MTDNWITSGTWDFGAPEKARMQSVMDEVQGIHILDMGTRDGTFALSLAQAHPKMVVTGIDTDASSIEWANAEAVKRKLDNVTFFVDDILNPKVPQEGYYDTVVVMETLEHLPPNQVQTAYDNCMSFLRNGGRLLITVPANTHISDEDHRQVFYREYVAGPDVVWIEKCPHLWIAWKIEKKG